ncbi:MAG: SDR family NAD(P)-dependent oxidoreductase, partial [Arenibacterium sp.]
MSFSVAGKTAIVTGAANGIGLAIARQFAENGANVMFADMDDKALKSEIGNIEEDGNIRRFAGDLRERLTIANLLSATLDAFDEVDILVNAARPDELTDPLDT